MKVALKPARTGMQEVEGVNSFPLLKVLRSNDGKCISNGFFDDCLVCDGKLVVHEPDGNPCLE